VRATDNLGGVQSPITSRSITYDTAVPNTTITAQPGDPTNATGASFSFTSTEGGSSFECRIDGGSWSACTSPKNYSGLGDGSHTFDVRATDAAGNTDASPASFTWTVDTAAPNTSITAQPNDPTNATGAAFSFSSSEGGSSYECRIDGGSWGACTSPKSYTGLADGSHTFDVRATDAAGNTDATPATFSWTVDTAAPNTSITRQPNDPTNAAGASFAFTATEGGSTFECNLDSGGWSSCVGPKSYTGLADGSHTFQVRATDAAGNTDASPASFTWTVDTAAAEHLDHRPARRPDERHRRELLLQLDRGRLELRVQPRLRRLGRLRQPEVVHRPGRRLAHLPGPRHRRGRQHRRLARRLHLDGRHGRAEHDDRRIAQRSCDHERRELLVLLEPGRLHVRVQPRLRRLGCPAPARRATPASPTARTRSWSARPTPPAHRRDARELHLDDRHRRAEHDHHRAAERPGEHPDADFSFTSNEGARRSSAGSTAAPGRVREPEELHRTGGRLAHLRRPRDRRRRQHRRDARDLHVDGRDDAARHRDRHLAERPVERDRRPASPSSANEGGSTFACKLDGGAFAACTSRRATRASR
jgi:hypothetical protein